MLPLASQTGETTSFIDALFTSVSSITTNGQTVLDTGMYWNRFGTTIILILMEIGGIGILLFTLRVFLQLSQYIPKIHKVLEEALNVHGDKEFKDLAIFSIILTLIFQTIGAILLSIQFIPEYGFGEGIYFGFFHSISSFTNAGFDLFENSLINYTSNSAIILTISFMVIIGSLGYVVWIDLFRGKNKTLLYTKIILSKTITFLLISTILFFIFEKPNDAIFDDLTLPQQIFNSFFLAVTPRSAGYVNVNYYDLTQPSIVLTFFLIVVGGSAGSKIKEIKLSSLSIFIHDLKGEKEHWDFNHFKQFLYRSRWLFMLFILPILASIALYIVEAIPEHLSFTYVAMEVFSCFTSVGMSLGLTPFLSTTGKFVLLSLMLIGKFGVIEVFVRYQKSKMIYFEHKQETDPNFEKEIEDLTL